MKLSLSTALAVVVVVGTASLALAQPRPAARTTPAARATPAVPATKVALLLSSDAPSFDDALAGLNAAQRQRSVRISAMIEGRPGDPDLIVGAGAAHVDAVRAASAQQPRRPFLLLDAEVPGAPNVRGIRFRVDEASFLAGVAAAAETRRGTVGFVGAMETPAFHPLECGYETGIRWASKELKKTVRGVITYIGTSSDAFADPAQGAQVSRALIAERNVDVLYAAAGGSSAGVLEAARAAHVRAIGSDAAPTPPARDVLLASVRRRFDRAIVSAVTDVRARAFQGGTVEMNLANGGVDLALPGRVAPATQKLLDRARAAIVSGREAPCVKYVEPPQAWNSPPRPAAP